MKPFCKLCLVNVADKKNSHIISKFLVKGIFENAPHKCAIQIEKKGISIKVQDSTKEHYLFCPQCEKRMSILESYFSRKLSDLLDYKSRPDLYKVLSLKGQKYTMLKSISNIEFYLFFYLQAWRLSISNSPNFENFKFSIEIEEKIRSFLDLNLELDHQMFIENLKDVNEFPEFNNCFVIPEEISKQNKGIVTAYEFFKDSYLILSVNFAFMIFTSDVSLNSAFKEFNNKNKRHIKVFLGNNESWQNLSNSIIEELKS